MFQFHGSTEASGNSCDYREEETIRVRTEDDSAGVYDSGQKKKFGGCGERLAARKLLESSRKPDAADQGGQDGAKIKDEGGNSSLAGDLDVGVVGLTETQTSCACGADFTTDVVSELTRSNHEQRMLLRDPEPEFKQVLAGDGGVHCLLCFLGGGIGGIFFCPHGSVAIPEVRRCQRPSERAD